MTYAVNGEMETVRFTARDAVALTLRLGFGTTRSEDRFADWAVVLDVASRELLAPLAWARSGAFIRRHADGSVVAAWRRAAIATQVRGERQLELLGAAITTLEAAAVDAVVLKGLPLGKRLYADAFVRCSSDIDLYVPARQRTRAASALSTLGWQRTDGAAPWHESWTLRRPDAEYHLELHSSLVSDHLAHLSVPTPGAAAVSIGGVAMWAHAGEFVAPYLAAHLATHQLPPLLWLVDFSTLWKLLSPSDRVRAGHAAQRAGLGRYLAWACQRASLVEGAAMDDSEALGMLGVESGRRRDAHSVWRHVALAASPRDRMRLIGAFLVPHRVRGDLKAMMSYTLARLRTRLTSLAGASRWYGRVEPHDDKSAGHAAGARALRLAREEMVELTRDVVGAGGSLIVRAPGGSMLPTIPRGALVRVGPLPPQGVSRGDVVLALTRDGEPVLHRALAVEKDFVVLCGDAAIKADPPVPFTRVIGVATHVRYDGVERALGRRPARSLAVSALKMRRRLARMVRRGR